MNITKNYFIVAFLALLVVISSYIIYLNIQIIDLNKSITTKDNLYKIQINNRINEIEQLNVQLKDLHKLLNIGLDLTKTNDVIFDTRLNNKDKEFIFKNIPNSSPLKEIFVTSNYGNRIHPILDVYKFHEGIDLRAEIGTNIYATADGIVSKIQNIDNGGYGKYIMITHNFGFQTIFAHLDNIFVEEGDIIKKGSIVGASGNSGRSNGPHLHYEIRYLNKPIDPLKFLYWNKKTFDSIFTQDSESINWTKIIEFIKSYNL